MHIAEIYSFILHKCFPFCFPIHTVDLPPIEQSIDDFAENISGALAKVEESAQSVAESSDQIASAVQELADGTTRQAESV